MVLDPLKNWTNFYSLMIRHQQMYNLTENEKFAISLLKEQKVKHYRFGIDVSEKRLCSIVFKQYKYYKRDE